MSDTPKQPMTFEEFAQLHGMSTLKVGNAYSDDDTNYAHWVWQTALSQQASIAQEAEPLNNMSNTPEYVQQYIQRQMPDNSKELKALITSPDLATMVSRFLGWKLPKDFAPDAGISFVAEYNKEYMASLGKPPMRHEPIGTNLFNADQAKEMLQHVLAGFTTELAQPLVISEDSVLPCDVTIGRGTVGKGCKWSTLMLRIKAFKIWYDQAHPLNTSVLSTDPTNTAQFKIIGYQRKCDTGWVEVFAEDIEQYRAKGQTIRPVYAPAEYVEPPPSEAAND